jgi:hypothetical protein
MSWLRRLVTGFSALRPEFTPRPVHVEFIMDTDSTSGTGAVRFPSVSGEMERCVQGIGGEMRERDHWGHTGADGRIILRRIFRK